MNEQNRQPDRRLDVSAGGADQRRLLRAVRRVGRPAGQRDVPGAEVPSSRRPRTKPPIDMVERAAAGLIERHGQDVDRGCRHPDHPHPDARHAVLRRRWRNGASPWHETELGARPAQRRMRGIRARAEGGAQPDRVGRGRNRADRHRAERGRSDVRPADGVRRKAQASVPGDGAAVGLVTLSDESPILDVECRTYGEFAGDMTLAVDPPRKWWQPGPGEGYIGFTESKITKVLARGNRQVPEVSYAVCDRIGVKPKDLDLLVTNQPNRVFLRNWREALELPEGTAPRYLRGLREPVRRGYPGQPRSRHLRRPTEEGRRRADGGVRSRRGLRGRRRRPVGRSRLMATLNREATDAAVGCTARWR